MSRKKKLLLLTATIVIILIVVGVVTFLYFPPATAAVGAIGVAIGTWCVTRAFDTLADQVAENMPLSRQSSESTEEHEVHVHTHTLTITRDTMDEDGRHVTETITDIISDDETKPRKHRLSE